MIGVLREKRTVVSRGILQMSLMTGQTLLPRLAPAALGLVMATFLAACAQQKAPATAAALVPAGQVDLDRLQAVDREPGSWLASGRDAGKTHYSPLDAINRDTVGRLGFAWEFQTGTSRGMQATPVMIDGVLYTSGVAGRVYALDAATGKLKWQFEPQVDLKNARSACCDLVNRGIAVWKGKIYVGAFDGQLYSLDARDGTVIWHTDTIADHQRGYSVTGAPLVAGKVVVIGNGGAEYDSRGYVSGFDLETGKLVWRFYTVPGDPSKPYESAALEKIAAPTWKGYDWQEGGGGNAWDAINYDPALNLVYFGTANGAPWSRAARSPGGGDNLFLASIVAVNADTGEYVWHYQETPGERWDYDATPHIMLTTLKIGGQDRNVLMQASKNGIFYVIDRKTGELLSADKFEDATWVDHIDMKTGRPVENVAGADYSDGKPKLLFPSSVGGHNFNPMSLSPKTGLVYIPSVHAGMVLLDGPKATKWLPGRMNTHIQIAFSAQLAAPQSLPEPMRKLADPAFLKKQPDIAMSASLKAWDPVARKVVWTHKNTSFMDHGGVLSTGGGLVVQGGLDGKLRVMNDETGEVLKEIDVGTAMIAAPMTYSVDGVQYIAILAGTGGGGWNNWFPENIAFKNGNANRILAFKLDGGATPQPQPLPPVQPIPEPPAQIGTPDDIKDGGALFRTNCASCHGNAEHAPLPDLRRSSAATHAAFQQIVRGGALQPRGMPRWDDLLTEAEVDKIHAFIISVARDAYAQQQGTAKAMPASGLLSAHP
jgi:quinohemoprotein ethanol dehydrogenase